MVRRFVNDNRVALFGRISSAQSLAPGRSASNRNDYCTRGSWKARASSLICLVLAIASPCRSLLAQYNISTVAGGAPQSTPVQAVNASIGNPLGVATDAGGNVYFTAQNCVFKTDRNGTLFLIAGNSHPGYSGDGGPAVAAQLHSPAGLAVDAAGNVYIADTLNHSIREVTTDGTITTIAGLGRPGYSGDGGQAVNGLLNHPTGLAIDSSGNLYVADVYNNRIRKISGGVINTTAGSGSNGIAITSTTSGAATAAALSQPNGVAVDGSGNIYIADTGDNGVKKIDTAGNISVIGGNGSGGYTGDGGKATSAQVAPYALASDSAGIIYVADLHNGRIRKISSGTITTVAGSGAFGFSGDGGKATSAALAVYGVAVDSSGNLYMVDSIDNRIREISSGGTITTVAGNGSLQYSGDGGAAINAELLFPSAVAVDSAGNYYIADTYNNAIREVTPGGIISTVAGNGSFGYSGDGGYAVNAQLGQPRAIVVDTAGNLYIADSAKAVVRKVTPDNTIFTVAGTGVPGYSGDGGQAAAAQLVQPSGLALDAAGNLYIADSDANAIRVVSPSGIINTVAGVGLPGFSGDGGPATAAQLNYPLDVAVDRAGNLFIADSFNNCIRKVSLDGTITTVAGTGAFGNSGDGGPAASAQLDSPRRVTVDGAGILYIVDSGNNTIRRVISDGSITTIAGNGTPGYSGDNGPATSAQLDQPSGIAVDASGNIYIADALNDVIRLLQPAPAQ